MNEEKIEKNFETFLKINNYINIINCIFFFGRLIGLFDFKANYIWICVIVFFSQIIVLLIGLAVRGNKLKSIKKSKSN